MLPKGLNINQRNKMTEKQYAPTKTEKKVSQKVEVPKIVEEPKKMTLAQEEKAEKIEEKAEEKNKGSKDEKKEKKKQPVKKIKKEEVVVNAKGLHISTKKAVAICDFIRGKAVENAIEDLEKVIALKKAVPMKGEIPHRKGKIMSGRYPVDTAKEFIVLLKSLNGNASNHDVEEPVVSFAVANLGNRPLGRFGRWKRKRTNIVLKARSKIRKEKK